MRQHAAPLFVFLSYSRSALQPAEIHLLHDRVLEGDEQDQHRDERQDHARKVGRHVPLRPGDLAERIRAVSEVRVIRHIGGGALVIVPCGNELHHEQGDDARQHLRQHDAEQDLVMVCAVDGRSFRIRMRDPLPERIHIEKVGAVQRDADDHDERTVDEPELAVQPVLRALPAVQGEHGNEQTDHIQRVREF